MVSSLLPHRRTALRQAAGAAFTAAVGATFLGLNAWSRAAAAADAPRVPTFAVGQETADAAIELEAALQAIQQSTVAAQVSGNVLQLAVKAGERVRRGQLLARIDERDAQAGLAQRDAGLAQAEAELRQARTNAERTRELRRQGFVSQAAVDNAETQLSAAQAGIQQASAARSQAALARGFAAVTAPFDGVVLATHVEAGELAAPGRSIVTLYAPGRLRAVVQVPTSLSAAARAATRTEVRLPDGGWITPAARAELPGADAVAQTVEWRLDLPAAAVERLQPGQAVRVRFAGVPVAAAAAPSAGAAPAALSDTRISVPASAVLRRGELQAVYAVQGGGFVLKPVRLGTATGDKVQVLAGLKVGERIALDPVRAGLAGAAPQ
jgi:RND family efflux transporter MFP subunit